MNEITTKQEETGLSRARQLHAEIITNVAVIGQAYISMTKGLKQMRDERLYMDLGFDTFDAYVDASYPFKARQAYTYISTLETLGEAFLQSNANLGVTKLELLKGLFAQDRQELIAENDVESMTVRELREQIEQLQQKGEQLSMFEEKAEKLEKENEELHAMCRDKTDGITKLNRITCNKEEELEQLRSAPVDVAVQEPDPDLLEEIREQARQEEEQKAEERIRAAKEQGEKMAQAKIKSLQARLDETGNAMRKAAQEKKKAEEELKRAEEEHKKELERIAAERAAADERAKAIEKKAALASNSDTATFKLYFEELQTGVKRLLEFVGRVEDSETKEKLQVAIRKYIGMIAEDVK